MSPSDGIDLTARVAILERNLGRLRVLALLTFALAAAVTAWSLTRRAPGIQEGSLWLAKDEQGRVRAMFGVSHDGVGLTMYDSTGQMRIDLGIAPGAAPGLMMLSRKGEPVAVLNLTDGTPPALRLINERTRERVTIAPTSAGSPISAQPEPPPDTLIARRPAK